MSECQYYEFAAADGPISDEGLRFARSWSSRANVSRGHQQPMTSKHQPHRRNLPPAKLDGMIEEATRDAYGESEQTGAFFTLIEERLKLPFETEVLGMKVTVEKVEMSDDEQIVAICSRDKAKQAVPILDLPLPTTPPQGADWIKAFRRWASGR